MAGSLLCVSGDSRQPGREGGLSGPDTRNQSVFPAAVTHAQPLGRGPRRGLQSGVWGRAREGRLAPWTAGCRKLGRTMEARGSPGQGRAGGLLGAADVRSRHPLGGQSPQWAGWRPGSTELALDSQHLPGGAACWEPEDLALPSVRPRIRCGDTDGQSRKDPRTQCTAGRTPQEATGDLSLEPHVPGLQLA